MSELKLKAGFWVRALLRQCSSLGANGVVAHKGDEDSGAILLKFYGGAQNCQVYSQVRDVNAQLAWLCVTGPSPVLESMAEQVIAKALAVDGDLWVVEIEDGAGRAVGLLENIIGV